MKNKMPKLAFSEKLTIAPHDRLRAHCIDQYGCEIEIDFKIGAITKKENGKHYTCSQATIPAAKELIK
jgi:hypothetical protein